MEYLIIGDLIHNILGHFLLAVLIHIRGVAK